MIKRHTAERIARLVVLYGYDSKNHEEKSNLKLNNDKSLKKKPERKPESPFLVFIRIQDSLISDSTKNTADHDPLVPEL